MQRDREIPSEPSEGAQCPDSPSHEGNTPASLHLSSPRQHLFLPCLHTTSVTVPFARLSAATHELLPTVPLPWMARSPQPSSMEQEV